MFTVVCGFSIFYHLIFSFRRKTKEFSDLASDVILVFNNFNNSYENYYSIFMSSLRACQINDMLISVFLALNNAALIFISDLFTERQTSISLRGKRRLVIPRVNTSNYGLHSFRYHASKPCKFLPDNVRVSTSSASFKIALKTVQLDNECCSFGEATLNSGIYPYTHVYFYL